MNGVGHAARHPTCLATHADTAGGRPTGPARAFTFATSIVGAPTTRLPALVITAQPDGSPLTTQPGVPHLLHIARYSSTHSSPASAPRLARLCAATRPHLRRDSPTSAPRLAHVCAETATACATTRDRWQGHCRRRRSHDQRVAACACRRLRVSREARTGGGACSDLAHDLAPHVLALPARPSPLIPVSAPHLSGEYPTVPLEYPCWSSPAAKCWRPVPVQVIARVGPTPGLGPRGIGEPPVPAQMWAGVSPIPTQMWVWAIPVLTRMWHG